MTRYYRRYNPQFPNRIGRFREEEEKAPPITTRITGFLTGNPYLAIGAAAALLLVVVMARRGN